jgi:hypothetical protein
VGVGGSSGYFQPEAVALVMVMKPSGLGINVNLASKVQTIF